MEYPIQKVWIKAAGWLRLEWLGAAGQLAPAGGMCAVDRYGIPIPIVDPAESSGVRGQEPSPEEVDMPASEEEIWMAIMKYCVCC